MISMYRFDCSLSLFYTYNIQSVCPYLGIKKEKCY